MNALYKNIEKEINIYEDLNFSNKVHAQFNKTKPLHRWVHYKEGFSDDLVTYYINKWKIKNGYILDPFTGSGTTLLQSQKLGNRSVGFEVNPFSHLMGEVKMFKWEVDELKEIKEHIEYLKGSKINNKEYEIPLLPRIHDIFEKEILKELLHYREYIFNIENLKIRKFFLLGYLSILEYNSNARKFCSGLRYIQRKNKNVYKHLFDKYEMMFEDISNKKHYSDFEIIQDSCLNASTYLADNTLDAFITSPPYANTFDYTNIYKIELWFGNFVKSTEDMRELRKKMLRSHVSTKPIEDGDIKKSQLNIKDELNLIVQKIQEDKLWNNHIPRMIWAYFEDMNILLHNLSKLLKKSGKGSIVVANSVYNGYVVPTDLLISKLAEQYNLKTEEIKIGRYIDYENSNNNRKPLKMDRKYIRESVVEFMRM